MAWKCGIRGSTRAADGRTPRRLLPLVLALCLAGSVGAGTGSGAGAPKGIGWDAVGKPAPTGTSWDSVIVRAKRGKEPLAERAVVRLGGRIVLRLRIIGGFAARVPAQAVGTLRHSPAVLSVTLDARLAPLAAKYTPPPDSGAVNSMAATTLMTGARAYWQAGFTGKGVGIALIDSGVAPVDGLTSSGKVVNGADLSFESQASNLRYLDAYGHGTHMAGIIAGRASAAAPGTYAADQTNFLGMAPDARIVSIKVADAHGAADVSQIIAAISWVVEHRNDNGLNIRVLNLSYGTDSAQSYKTDPLAYAAEQAWKSGVVVVVAIGNAGFVGKTGTLTSPATDPYVLAVGASDSRGTSLLGDDTIAVFSSSGSRQRHVDLIAPGTHVASLRVLGSNIDETYGGTGRFGDGLFLGSGTSQAAAVVSGAAALIIEQHPSITPDDLKYLLTSTAADLGHPRFPNELQGDGELNLARALTAPIVSRPQSFTSSGGNGSLEQARGSVHLVKDGEILSGEKDIFGKPFESAAMALLEASGSSWSGGTWNGSSWSGSSWSGSSWSGSSWSGSSWSGSSWSGSSWSYVAWSGSSWSGSSWSGSSWSDNNWLGGTWADNVWADAAWS